MTDSCKNAFHEWANNVSRDELLELLQMDSKNWLAIDGVWFQSVEKKFGMAEAVYHDEEAWKRFTLIEAQRIKKFLHLSDHPGLEGLKQALPLRINNRSNLLDIRLDGNSLFYRVVVCRVQSARSRQGKAFHPCKSVGELEYAGFAKGIDDRIACRCLSCYPDVRDHSCACSWEFFLPS